MGLETGTTGCSVRLVTGLLCNFSIMLGSCLYIVFKLIGRPLFWEQL